MEQNANKYINVSYKLYDITNGEPRLLEETTPDHPFIFISGMGVVLPKFEENLINMAQGETFEFVLTPEEAYGERTEKHIVNVARETFCQNGHFDHDNVFVGAEIPLQNEDGNRFTGKVMEIADDNVKIDLNHPLAGLTLRFTGEILETREATIEEMTRLAKLISGECGADMAITTAAAIITTKRVRPTKPSPNEEHIRQPVYLDNLWGEPWSGCGRRDRRHARRRKHRHGLHTKRTGPQTAWTKPHHHQP